MRYFAEQALDSHLSIKDDVVRETKQVYSNSCDQIDYILELMQENTLRELIDKYIATEVLCEKYIDIMKFMICKNFEDKICLLTELGVF